MEEDLLLLTMEDSSDSCSIPSGSRLNPVGLWLLAPLLLPLPGRTTEGFTTG